MQRVGSFRSRRRGADRPSATRRRSGPLGGAAAARNFHPEPVDSRVRDGADGVDRIMQPGYAPDACIVMQRIGPRGGCFPLPATPFPTKGRISMAKKLLALLVLAALAGLATAQEQMPTVNGRTGELSICDNQTTPEGSINCAARFVDEGVIGVLGAISSTMSIAAAEPLEEAGIIMISTSSTNPATTQIGEHIFRMAYTDDFQGRVAARYAANDLGAERAIVFRQQDDDYSFGLAGFFAEEFEAR